MKAAPSIGWIVSCRVSRPICFLQAARITSFRTTMLLGFPDLLVRIRSLRSGAAKWRAKDALADVIATRLRVAPMELRPEVTGLKAS